VLWRQPPTGQLQPEVARWGWQNVAQIQPRANQPPVARIDASAAGQRAQEGQELRLTVPPGGEVAVALSGARSEDPERQLTQWEWAVDGRGAGVGREITRPFRAGTHAITVTVRDAQGATAQAQVRVVVTETVPPLSAKIVGVEPRADASTVTLTVHLQHTGPIYLSCEFRVGGQAVPRPAQRVEGSGEKRLSVCSVAYQELEKQRPAPGQSPLPMEGTVALWREQRGGELHRWQGRVGQLVARAGPSQPSPAVPSPQPPPAPTPDPQLLAQVQQARVAWQQLNEQAGRAAYPTPADRAAVSQDLQRAGQALEAAEAAARRGDRVTVQAQLGQAQQALATATQRLAQLAQRPPQPMAPSPPSPRPTPPSPVPVTPPPQPPPARPDPQLVAQVQQVRAAWDRLNAQAAQFPYPTAADRAAVSQDLQRAGQALQAAEAATQRGDRTAVQGQLALAQQALGVASQRLTQLAQRPPQPLPPSSTPSRPTQPSPPVSSPPSPRPDPQLIEQVRQVRAAWDRLNAQAAQFPYRTPTDRGAVSQDLERAGQALQAAEASAQRGDGLGVQTQMAQAQQAIIAANKRLTQLAQLPPQPPPPSSPAPRPAPPSTTPPTPIPQPPPPRPDPQLVAQLQQVRGAWDRLNAQAAQFPYPTPADQAAVSQDLQRAGQFLQVAETAAQRGDQAAVQAQLAQVQQVLNTIGPRLTQLSQRPATPAPPATPTPTTPQASAQLFGQVQQLRGAWQQLNDQAGRVTYPTPADRTAVTQELARVGELLQVAETAAQRGDQAAVQNQLLQVRQVLNTVGSRLTQLAQRPPQAPPASPTSPTPTLTGIMPSPVPGADGLQTLTLTGSGFVAGSQVALRMGGAVYIIPPDRIAVMSPTQIQIRANVARTPATWTAEVMNPGGLLSSRLPFSVVVSAQPAPVPGPGAVAKQPLVGRIDATAAAQRAQEGQELRLTVPSGGEAQVTLSGARSQDPEGQPLRYVWESGRQVLGTGREVTRPFRLGTHEVTLTVRDAQGGTAQAQVRVVVSEPAPTPPGVPIPGAPSPAAPQITTGATTLKAGELIQISGSGFTPQGSATIQLRHSSGTLVPPVQVRTDPSGKLSAQYQLPAEVPIGTYTLSADDKGRGTSNTVSLTVVSSGSPPAPTPTAPGSFMGQPPASVQIDVSALGKSARQGEILQLAAPNGVPVTVTLSGKRSISPFGRRWAYRWEVNGRAVSEDPETTHPFEGGDYKVKLTVVEASPTAGSTPMFASSTSLVTEVSVRVRWNRHQNCPGRIGQTCSPGERYLGLEKIGTPATASHDCLGEKCKFRITSRASVGATQHDACCTKNPDGVECPGRDPKKKITACQLEWDRAKADFFGIFNNVMFGHPLSWVPEAEWVYDPEDPNDRDTAARTPKAPPGIQVAGEFEKGYCRSNKVRRIQSDLRSRMEGAIIFVCE